jgi:hypothetical protein
VTEHQLLGALVMLTAVSAAAVWTLTYRVWAVTTRILQDTTEISPVVKTILEATNELLRRTR